MPARAFGIASYEEFELCCPEIWRPPYRLPSNQNAFSPSFLPLKKRKPVPIPIATGL
jgi:hypothetical protein